MGVDDGQHAVVDGALQVLDARALQRRERHVLSLRAELADALDVADLHPPSQGLEV
ncbi:hypothetical protein D3C80_2087700 [compost metagenome]